MNKFIKPVILLLCLVLGLGMIGCDNGEAEIDDTFCVEYDGAVIELGAKAKPILDKLGKADKEQNTGNCGGLGETVCYYYGAMELVVVYYEKSDARIDRIELNNDSVETAKGIYIGSKKDDVVSTYGDPDKDKSNSVSYSDNGKNLVFGIESGKVSSITFYCSND